MLLLAAREVARVLVQEPFDRHETDPFEGLGDETTDLIVTLGDVMDPERVTDGGEDRHRRVERGMRVLENELEPLAQGAELPLGKP